MIRSRRARGEEEGGEAGEKRGRGKIPAIYSANFGGAGQTRGGRGEGRFEAETARCAQDVSLEK